MYFPREIIVQSEVVHHPITEKIIARSPESNVIVCDLPSVTPDDIILKQYSKLYSKALSVAERRKISRKIMFLHKSDNIIATMAAGSNPLKCCHNFKKITPYKAACLFNCEYCWFKDPDLMMRVNVAFFDHLNSINEVIWASKDHDPVFTFTHYKTDCLAIEHLTGFIKDLVDFFAKSNGYLILLTKSGIVQPLLGLQHNRHTIMQWSMNAPEFTRKYERGAGSLVARIRAAKRLRAENYPIVLRIDPIFAFDNWKAQYQLMIDTVFESVRPDHITLGIARFQGPTEIQQIIDNGYGAHRSLLQSQNPHFVFAKLNASSGYQSSENPFENTMADMPYTYPDEFRYELLNNIISRIKVHDPDISIGICEETKEMWDELGLIYRNDKNLDCACNYTGFQKAI